MSMCAGQELAEYIRSRRTIREYQKGDVICAQDDNFTDVYYLQAGIVKIYDIDDAGNERAITLFGEGSVFPVTWLLMSPPSAPFFFYEALTSVSCALADVHDVRELVRSRPDILQLLTDHLVRSYINLSARIVNLGRSRVGERLEFVLFHLAMRLGKIDGEVAQLDASITQEELAQMAGVTRESLSVELNSRRTDRPYWRASGHTYINLRSIDPDVKSVVLSDNPSVTSDAVMH